MPEVVAVLLAAGRGVRMGGVMPKTLIPLEEDGPLLDYILRGIAGAGVGKLVVVTGFMPDALKRHVASCDAALDVTFVHNPLWEERGNYHSLRVALEALPQRAVLAINCDVIVVPKVYQRVASAEADLALAVQRRNDLNQEDMRVRVEDGSVTAISKQLDMSESHGEFAGVSLLRPAAAGRYITTCDRNDRAGRTSGYYEDVFAQILDDRPAAAVEVPMNGYAEVDVPEDVPAARAVIASNRGAWG